jgi:hypothetical protein
MRIHLEFFSSSHAATARNGLHEEYLSQIKVVGSNSGTIARWKMVEKRMEKIVGSYYENQAIFVGRVGKITSPGNCEVDMNSKPDMISLPPEFYFSESRKLEHEILKALGLTQSPVCISDTDKAIAAWDQLWLISQSTQEFTL